MNVSDFAYFSNIRVYDLKRNQIVFLSWNGLRWELRLKYDWYFKYRAALLQVKYPKYTVELFSGKEPATGKTLEQIRQGIIRGKKSKITKYKNLLIKAEQNWTSIFPIEDDLQYQKAVEKIKRLETELQLFEN